MIDAVKEIFPLLRGRTGVETLTRTVPVVLRFYRGNLRVLTYRTKAKCSISGNQARIATSPIDVPYSKIGNLVTEITIAFDYPLIDRIESCIQLDNDLKMGKRGTITLTPIEGQLLILTGEMPS